LKPFFYKTKNQAIWLGQDFFEVKMKEFLNLFTKFIAELFQQLISLKKIKLDK
jgi:hypothetical protein